MSTALQWVIVAVVVAAAILGILRIFRRSRCSGCDSNTCPIRRRNRR